MVDLFEFAAKYPNAVGYRHRDTSKEAAARVQNVQQLHGQIMAALKTPLTDYELAEAMGLEFRRVQPRRSELAAQGKVIDSGDRRKTPYGRAAICWVVAR